MVKRHLPDQHNPLVEPEHTPQLEILVERRRLGSTDLSTRVDSDSSSSPAAKVLGVFDYAHLRVPLPKDLKGSGIFQKSQHDDKYPESYFLMRRSSDGFISATGMFKASFPWASQQEEQAERKFHKELLSAGSAEVAGNVWISPEAALKLSDEYNMRAWIVALLDPEPFDKGTKSTIQSPPKFTLPKKYALAPTEGTNTVRTSRKRDLRSQSPSKIATPARKIASPRKRQPKKSEETPTPAAGKELNKIVNGTAPSTEPESLSGDKVRVEVNESVEKKDDVETVHTTVRVEMPAGAPELPLPDNAEDMIAQAKEMVDKARETEGLVSKKSKRKAESLDQEEDDESVGGPVQPAKKVKVMEETLRKQKVRNRALIGIVATMAVGSVIPYFL